MFIIGLEFSIEKFSAIKRYALLGGLLQVVLTTVMVMILTSFAMPLNHAVFMGFLVCFSSTAIVMKLIQKKQLTHTLQGRVTLGILIFQDIAVILVLLLTPLLGGQSLNLTTLPMVLAQVIGLALIIIVVGLYIVPRALREAAKTKNRDLFMLLILFICLGTTFGTSAIGISPELGAFIAGLIISNTDYAHQTLGYIQPFQDVFMSIFLISIGLMINVNYFIQNILLIILLSVIVLLVKFVATLITGELLKIPIRTTIAISILLSQIGEFSFVLAGVGIANGLLSSELFTMFLAVSIITMSSTPFLQSVTPRIISLFKKIPYFQVDDELLVINEEETDSEILEDHVIIVGFGVNGKNLSRACYHYHIPYVIVDLNPLIVEKEKALGLPIIYGDASNESVLKELNVTGANCMIIATSNYASTLKTIDSARILNPNLHIIVRTRYLKNVDEVYEAGADVVIPEEFETSIVIFTKLMDYYDKDVDEVTDTIETLRSDNYHEFRSIAPDELTTRLNEKLTDLTVESLYVDDKKQLDEYEFKKYDLTVAAIIRDNKTILGISPKFELEHDDLILFTGNEDNIEAFLKQVYSVNIVE